MLKGHTWLLVGGALMVGIVIIAVTRDGEPVQTGHTAQSKLTQEERSPSVAPLDRGQGERSDSTSLNSGAADLTSDGVLEDEAGAFRTNETGQLLVNEQTRLSMEALIAHAEPDELLREVREQVEHLHPTAAREAEELMQRYVQYLQAQRQTYPPRDTAITEDDAIRELDGLHALREAHFGPQVAAQLFGREEAVAREMIEVMRVENDQSLTPEEKQKRAQALREHLPSVRAIEKGTRESARSRDQDQQM